MDLAQSLGLSPRSPLELVDFDEPDVPLKDMNELSKLAFTQRPDMLVAQRNVDAATAAYDAARTLNYPALSTFAGVTYQGRANGVQYPTFNLQLAIDFQVWDGGEQAGATINAQGGDRGGQGRLHSRPTGGGAGRERRGDAVAHGRA